MEGPLGLLQIRFTQPYHNMLGIKCDFDYLKDISICEKEKWIQIYCNSKLYFFLVSIQNYPNKIATRGKRELVLCQIVGNFNDFIMIRLLSWVGPYMAILGSRGLFHFFSRQCGDHIDLSPMHSPDGGPLFKALKIHTVLKHFW